MEEVKGKTSKKTMIFAIVGVVVVVLLAAIWLGSSWYATTQAKKKVDDFLFDNKMEDYIHWKDLSASPAGDITLSGVTLGKKEDWMADEIVIREFNRDRDGVALDMSIRKLSDDSQEFAPSVMLPSVLRSYIIASGRASAKPLDIDVNLNINFEDNEGDFFLRLESDDFAEVEFEAKLDKVKGLRNSREKTSNPLSVFDETFELNVQSLRVKYNDDGMLKRMGMLEKRYLSIPMPSGKEEKLVTGISKDSFVRKCSSLKFILEDPQDACSKIYDAHAGEASGISFEATAKRSVPWDEIVDTLSNLRFRDLTTSAAADSLQEKFGRNVSITVD
ncbi:hypothetical protein [Pelistega europaea]|uniref:Uncharacterized protein n=1 Tax=Pelistega europaea TaxID=106147 RepID=A0A7Y4L8B5_9BURK|nr:hypothetical protein [Pelistega europaea]NOL48829.1 hypothetical protein [Pelistega europaea]